MDVVDTEKYIELLLAECRRLGQTIYVMYTDDENDIHSNYYVRPWEDPIVKETFDKVDDIVFAPIEPKLSVIKKNKRSGRYD